MALKALKPRLAPVDTKAYGDNHQPKSRWGHGRGGRPWRRLKDTILTRDRHTCQHCKRVGGDLELDHIVNVANGGTDDESNLQILCKELIKIEDFGERSRQTIFKMIRQLRDNDLNVLTLSTSDKTAVGWILEDTLEGLKHG